MELRFGGRTWVMGIVIVTPDSFCGDGLAPDGASAAEIVEAAVGQSDAFVAAGAQLLDVGGESTRPRQFYGERRAVSVDEEREAVVPVVAALAERFGERALISVDTTRGEVARAALAAGAGMVNDVWAARRDPDTARAAAEVGAYLVLMHNKELAAYDGDVVDEVVTWLRESIDLALAAGVARDRLLIDPGIGFGKTGEHNLEILHRLAELKAALGLPLLVGTSRKRFIGQLLDDAPPDDRVEGTAATVALAIAAGTDVVRVHDVAHIARTVRVADAIIRR
jgi:dihydropteroate synthase